MCSLIVDTKGGGVGTTGTVNANKHLTELQKMTFKKKAPDLISLFFHSPLEETADAQPVYKRLFRVSKRDLFVETLQKNMVRFR